MKQMLTKTLFRDFKVDSVPNPSYPSVLLTKVLCELSDGGRQTVFTAFLSPSTSLVSTLFSWLNIQQSLGARRWAMYACSVTGSPRYAACVASLNDCVCCRCTQEGTPKGPWSTEITKTSGVGCETERWRVEDIEERRLETLTSKQKITRDSVTQETNTHIYD